MSNSYTPTTWIDGESVIEQDKMNKIEMGIDQNAQMINEVSDRLADVEILVNDSIDPYFVSTVNDKLSQDHSIILYSSDITMGDGDEEDPTMTILDRIKNIDQRLDNLPSITYGTVDPSSEEGKNGDVYFKIV